MDILITIIVLAEKAFKNAIIPLWSILSLTFCKPPANVDQGNSSHLKTLDNFTATNSGDFVVNKCSSYPDKSLQVLLKTKEYQDKIKIDPKYFNSWKDQDWLELYGSLYAVPKEIIATFFKMDGEIHISSTSSNICQSHKKSNTTNSSKEDELKACWYIDIRKPVIVINGEKVNGQRKWVRHSLVREFGFILIDYLPQFTATKVQLTDPAYATATSWSLNHKAYPTPENSLFANQLANTFFQEVHSKNNKNKYNLDRFIKNGAVTSHFSPWTFAEAFDSYFCNKTTRGKFQQTFPKTYNVFDQEFRRFLTYDFLPTKTEDIKLSIDEILKNDTTTMTKGGTQQASIDVSVTTGGETTVQKSPVQSEKVQQQVVQKDTNTTNIQPFVENNNSTFCASTCSRVTKGLFSGLMLIPQVFLQYKLAEQNAKIAWRQNNPQTSACNGTCCWSTSGGAINSNASYAPLGQEFLLKTGLDTLKQIKDGNLNGQLNGSFLTQSTECIAEQESAGYCTQAQQSGLSVEQFALCTQEQELQNLCSRAGITNRFQGCAPSEQQIGSQRPKLPDSPYINDFDEKLKSSDLGNNNSISTVADAPKTQRPRATKSTGCAVVSTLPTETYTWFTILLLLLPAFICTLQNVTIQRIFLSDRFKALTARHPE